MGIPVLVLGSSGSGKSASLRNFKPGEIGIFNVAGKPLPFRGNFKTLDNVRIPQILERLRNPKTPMNAYVIDDSQYLMAFTMFDKANETGYAKFTEIAQSFYMLVRFVAQNLPEDTIVYFLHHTELNELGQIKAKTSGKMIDSQLTLEGLFSIVLLCEADGTDHHFITQSDGTQPAKSPIDMLANPIDNDLKKVDAEIREYWGLSELGKTNRKMEEKEND